MPPIINFKICDNSADCNGITMCPAHVFAWDEVRKTITTDLSKCVECGKCANFCGVKAIQYAKNKRKARKIQREIDKDPRTIADLFVDRYGAATIENSYTFDPTPEKVANRIKSNRPVIVEFNTRDTIECMLKCIPISFIADKFAPDATYSKFYITEGDFKTYGVTTTPCLRFYKNGELVGSVDGFYDNARKFELFDKIPT